MKIKINSVSQDTVLSFMFSPSKVSIIDSNTDDSFFSVMLYRVNPSLALNLIAFGHLAPIITCITTF